MQENFELIYNIETQMMYIRAITNILLDALEQNEYSGDYWLLLKIQQKHIREISKLF